mmetsp:Transcript_8923/g.23358  ORF Transcript_8923/g.23358 Transcript_8923/m.23358 type:complete len:336 (-) Transcript_8923:948-1955(-)
MHFRRPWRLVPITFFARISPQRQHVNGPPRTVGTLFSIDPDVHIDLRKELKDMKKAFVDRRVVLAHLTLPVGRGGGTHQGPGGAAATGNRLVDGPVVTQRPREITDRLAETVVGELARLTQVLGGPPRRWVREDLGRHVQCQPLARPFRDWVSANLGGNQTLHHGPQHPAAPLRRIQERYPLRGCVRRVVRCLCALHLLAPTPHLLIRIAHVLVLLLVVPWRRGGRSSSCPRGAGGAVAALSCVKEDVGLVGKSQFLSHSCHIGIVIPLPHFPRFDVGVIVPIIKRVPLVDEHPVQAVLKVARLAAIRPRHVGCEIQDVVVGNMFVNLAKSCSAV